MLGMLRLVPLLVAVSGVPIESDDLIGIMTCGEIYGIITYA